jgi:hypothetical protein
MFALRAFVPEPRRHGVVSQQVDGETLLYVEDTHQASALNGPASRIWALCDGRRSVESIAGETELLPDVVAKAIKEFADAGLLENPQELPATLSRRRVVAGVGLALPIILMVMAPGAKAAASTPCIPPGSTCTVGGSCCSDPGVQCSNIGGKCT